MIYMKHVFLKPRNETLQRKGMKIIEGGHKKEKDL